jgi:hypothetical protein
MNRSQTVEGQRAASSSIPWMRAQSVTLVTLFTVTFYRVLFLPYLDFIAFPREMFALTVVCSALQRPVRALYIYQTRCMHRMRQWELYEMYRLITDLLHDPLHMGGSMYHRWRTHWTEDDAILFHTRLQSIARVLINYFPGLVDPVVGRWADMPVQNASFPLDQTNIPDVHRRNRHFHLRALSFLFSRQYQPGGATTWYQHCLLNQRLELELALRRMVDAHWFINDPRSRASRENNMDELRSFIPLVDNRLRLSVDFVDDVDAQGYSYTAFDDLNRLVARFPWIAVGSVRIMTHVHHGFRYPR